MTPTERSQVEESLPTTLFDRNWAERLRPFCDCAVVLMLLATLMSTLLSSNGMMWAIGLGLLTLVLFVTDVAITRAELRFAANRQYELTEKSLLALKHLDRKPSEDVLAALLDAVEQAKGKRRRYRHAAFAKHLAEVLGPARAEEFGTLIRRYTRVE